jgi:hypothetical protein
MTTESLVALQHGAKLAGVEQEQLTTSLDFFNRTLGEAERGSTQAARALAQIGLAYKDIAVLSSEERFGLIADQINKLGSESQKAAARQDLFGRSSQQMAALLAEGSKGLAASRLEADKLGLSFSRLNAAQVEAANDALTRSKALVTGLFRQTAIESAPYIEAAASALNDWAMEGEGVGEKVTKAFELMSIGAVKFGGEVANLHNRWLEMKADVQDIIPLWEKLSPLGMAHKFRREIQGRPTPQDLAAQYRGQKVDVSQQINQVEQFYAGLRAKAAERAAQIEQRPKTRATMPAGEMVLMAEDETRDVVERTRDALDAIRHMEGLTRRERIENLRAYSAANADELSKVAAANRLLHDEILMLDRSRLDAMKVYNAEMRERIQEPYLTGMEYAAQFTRYSEGQWKGFWDPVIDGSKKASDAVDDFFRNLAINFAQMQAQKAMMSIWDAALGPILTSAATAAFGGLGGAGGSVGKTFENPGAVFGAPASVGHRGGRVGTLTEHRWVDPSVFENAPRFHDLRPGETAVIAQDDEVISRPGKGGGNELLKQILAVLQQRQQINLSANVVDRRDVVTASQMEGKAGEKWTMYHVGRNG